MKENIKIYLAWGPSGEYDTYYEECLGAFLKRENAEKAGKEWYDKKTNSNNDLPMTLEEFQKLNFGYADDDYEEEGERGRDGYTEEDFERMDEAWDNQYNPFFLNTSEAGGKYLTNQILLQWYGSKALSIGALVNIFFNITSPAPIDKAFEPYH